MSILTGLAWRELTQLPHPVISRKQCLNSVRRSHCNACGEICPEQVIGEDLQVKSWSRCTDCSRCVTACPTRAIGVSERGLRQILSLREGDETLFLSCECSESPSHQWGCLCELSWEALAYLAAHRPLELDLSPCKACQKTSCRELLGEELKKLHRFLGAETFERVVTLRHRPKEKQERPLSRRELLRQTGERSGEGLRDLLRHNPLLEGEELQTDGQSMRKLMGHRWAQSGAVLSWDIPAVKDTCTACGVCVGSCPAKALRVEGRDLILESWRCVQCGTCATVCPNRAVSGYETVQLRSLGLLRLREGKVKACRVCGGALKPNSKAAVCPACMRERMAQAAQRTKRREESD
jgi:ferredoxin